MKPDELKRRLRENPQLRAENAQEAMAYLSDGQTVVKADRAREIGTAPSEEAEQAAVVRWAAFNEVRLPELAWLLHIPNGGARNAATGAMLKRTGVRAGVPDLLLPCPRVRAEGGSWHGLFVEMKRADHSNSPSHEQKRWLDYLRRAGYMVVVAYGAEQAIEAIKTYLGDRP